MPIHTPVLKSNISQSAHYIKNMQDLSMKRRHLTSVHPSNLFFYFKGYLLSKQRCNRRLFLTSAEFVHWCFDQYVKNASNDMKMLTPVMVGF